MSSLSSLPTIPYSSMNPTPQLPTSTRRTDSRRHPQTVNNNDQTPYKIFYNPCYNRPINNFSTVDHHSDRTNQIAEALEETRAALLSLVLKYKLTLEKYKCTSQQLKTLLVKINHRQFEESGGLQSLANKVCPRCHDLPLPNDEELEILYENIEVQIIHEILNN